MIAAADAAAEIDEAPIRAPRSGARKQVPARGQVLHLTAISRHAVHVYGAAVILLCRNHGIQILLSAENNVAPIR